MPRKKKTNSKTVETLIHDEVSLKNIPTAEYQSVIHKEEQSMKVILAGSTVHKKASFPISPGSAST